MEASLEVTVGRACDLRARGHHAVHFEVVPKLFGNVRPAAPAQSSGHGAHQLVSVLTPELAALRWRWLCSHDSSDGIWLEAYANQNNADAEAHMGKGDEKLFVLATVAAA